MAARSNGFRSDGDAASRASGEAASGVWLRESAFLSYPACPVSRSPNLAVVVGSAHHPGRVGPAALPGVPVPDEPLPQAALHLLPPADLLHQLSPPAGLVAALLAAAPGERLPQLPKPTHVFRPTNLALVAGSSRLGSRREKVKVAGFSIHQRQFETVLEIFRWSSMPRC